MRLSPQLSPAFAAQAQTAQAAQLQPANTKLSTSSNSRDIPSLQLPTPGTEIYTAKRGEAIPTIARQYLNRTAYLTSSELAEAIRKVNGNRSNNILNAGEQITIPGILLAPIAEKTIPVPKDFEV